MTRIRSFRKFLKQSFTSSLTARSPGGTGPKCSYDTKRRLLDLAPEILFLILRDSSLPLPSVLAFALASRSCYRVALSVLNEFVIITPHNEELFRRRIDEKDPLNEVIRRVQIGRIDRVGYGVRWNVSNLLTGFLSAFSQLQKLETCGGTFVKGWEGVDDIGRVLGDRLRELEIKVTPPIVSRTMNVVFPHLHTLHIRFIPYEYTEIGGILPNISSYFPSLVDLSLTFRSGGGTPSVRFVSCATLFNASVRSKPHFPRLNSFHLTIPLRDPLYLQPDDMNGLISFLQMHAKTLRELSLPSWYPTGDALAHPILNLRQLRTSSALASYLSPEPMEELVELFLDGHLPAQDQDPSPFLDLIETRQMMAGVIARWPFKNVRMLNLKAGNQPVLGQVFTLRYIPDLFPKVETFHLNFTCVSHLLQDYVNAWTEDQRLIVNRAKNLRHVSFCQDRTTERTLYFKVARPAIKEIRSHGGNETIRPLIIWEPEAKLVFVREERKVKMPGSYWESR